MFVVAGVTGHTGRVVAETLLSKGRKVRVLVRDEQKGAEWRSRGAEVAVGTLEDPASLARAFQGAEGAYLLVPPDVRSTDPLGRAKRLVGAMAEALRKAPVPHVVFLSSVGAQHPAGTGPVQGLHVAEQELSQLPGTRLTFLRAAYFLENLQGSVGAMKEQGVLPVFGGGESQPFPMVHTRDIGEVAARALLEPPQKTQVLELAGPKEHSMADVAAAFGQVLGKPVKAQALPIDMMVPTLTGFGLSLQVAAQYREMTEAMGKGKLQWEGGKAMALRGRVTLDAFASEVAKGR